MSHDPRSPRFTPMAPKLLPPLKQHPSPNKSSRNGVVPYLIVVHRPVGRYGPSIDWLCNPKSQASCHVITEGQGSGVDVATQLVPWNEKSWSCVSFNSMSYNVEVDDDAWDSDDFSAFFSAAHVCAWLCHKTGIPAAWTQDPNHKPGVVRHIDLGRAGGGHTDPTTNLTLWRNFVKQIKSDVTKTSWRQSYGKGRLIRIK